MVDEMVLMDAVMDKKTRNGGLHKKPSIDRESGDLNKFYLNL